MLLIQSMEPSSIEENLLECTYSNDFSPNKWEGGLRQDSPPAQKLAFRALDAVELDKWSRVLPITKSNSIMVWSTYRIKMTWWSAWLMHNIPPRSRTIPRMMRPVIVRTLMELCWTSNTGHYQTKYQHLRKPKFCFSINACGSAIISMWRHIV